MTEIRIRPARTDDRDAVYAISLATGDAGKDASHLYRDGRLIGHIYSAPYLALRPDCAFVVEDSRGVAGYIVGTFDTAAFEVELEKAWWPALRQIYPRPQGEPDTWDADQRRAFLIHEPATAPASLTSQFPGHLHMNLLPRLQGRGTGTALLTTWLDTARKAGLNGVHVGANSNNRDGIRFWSARGFGPLAPPVVPENSRTVWLGQRL